MAIEVYKRLNYLNEITEKLVELDASEDVLRLSSFYGLTTKEICFKNLVKSFRWDKLKLKRCPKCHAYIDFNLARQIDRKEQQKGERKEERKEKPIDKREKNNGESAKKETNKIDPNDQAGSVNGKEKSSSSKNDLDGSNSKTDLNSSSSKSDLDSSNRKTDSDGSNRKVNFKVKRKRLLIRCSQCRFTKSFAINSQYKTIYEKLYSNYLNGSK